MKKPAKKIKLSRRASIILTLILIILIVSEETQRNNAVLVSLTQTATVASTPVGAVPSVTATPAGAVSTPTPAPTETAGVQGATPTITLTATASATEAPRPTRQSMATDVPGLEVTPMRGQLYEITGTVNAMGCPDTRCKVVDVYKRNNIIVVTGTVMGTTYKGKKSRVWYQVLSHDGSKVYVHGEYVSPHQIRLSDMM